jgi:hypothetical protein
MLVKLSGSFAGISNKFIFAPAKSQYRFEH